MNHPALVIFDMDGLMFDTENISHETWIETSEKFGFPMDRAITDRFIGTTGKNVMRIMAEIYGLEVPLTEWREYQQALKAAKVDCTISKESFKKRGLYSLLKYLKSNNITACVASCSEAYKVSKLLQETGTLEYFDFWISGDEVVCGKPEPEIFQKACNKAGIPPKQALVLEDSLSGIRAAYLAGIPSFFIPDRIEPNDEIKAKSDKIFDSLEEVKSYLSAIYKKSNN
jgi:beta-phosphoglucomutase